jgi:tetratricopeptide (TPR) repeat protein
MGIAGLVLFGVFMIFNEDSSKPQKTVKTKKPEPIREPAGFVFQGSGEHQSEFSKSVDAFFKAGFREYREGNYLRAKQQFEMALQIDPNHALSKRYHQITLTQIQNEIDDLFERGRKAEFSGKLKEAKANYESILRLLSRDKDHPRYLQAKERLSELAKVGGPR